MNEWEWQLLEDKTVVDAVDVAGTKVRAGDRVRLRPGKRGDILDMALDGQIATIECLEQDYEGKSHICVVLDDDPGRDMGLLRQPGHRFFFDPDEVEPLPQDKHAAKRARSTTHRILVAGIGNIFLGDDGFGVEVVRRLAHCELPASVRVSDFGIRGFDLAYALQDGYDVTILVDACARGAAAGTVYIIEPDLEALEQPEATQGFVETHGMHPMNVLRMAKGMNAQLKRVFVVGCEPASLGGEEGAMELSSAVEASLDQAVETVRSLIARSLQELDVDAKD
jgi:hydrogenase maturation protease